MCHLPTHLDTYSPTHSLPLFVSVIRRLAANVVTTHAGLPATSGDADGPPASARFNADPVLGPRSKLDEDVGGRTVLQRSVELFNTRPETESVIAVSISFSKSCAHGYSLRRPLSSSAALCVLRFPASANGSCRFLYRSESVVSERNFRIGIWMIETFPSFSSSR